MGNEVRILLLEDAVADAELLERALTQDGIACHVRRVETQEDFVQGLKHFSPDLVISDFSLPKFDGITALEMARSMRPDLPFIFVSGTIGEDAAIMALANGASDYVLKDRMKRLPAVVRRVLSDAEQRVARYHSEQGRIKAEYLYFSLAEISRDAVLALRDGQIVMINEAGLSLYGARRHRELIGRQLFDFVHKDSREAFLAWTQAAQEHRQQPHAQKHVTLDGTEVPVELTATRVEQAGESVVLVVVRRI